MYKFQEPDWRGDIEPGVFRLADGTWIPFDLENTDYQNFLQAILDHGTDILEGEAHSKLQTDLKIITFNHHLHKYTQATARLARRDLSVTVPAVVEETVIGYEHNDVTGLSKAVVETVTVTEEIPAEPATVTVEDEQIANPVLVKDQEERAAAQAIIAATPPDVVTAYENSLET
jgi:hypothetical protein